MAHNNGNGKVDINLAEYNRIRKEIEKRRGQIDSLNKCIHYHSERILTAFQPTSLNREGKLLKHRVDAKKIILSELQTLEKKLKRFR